MWGWHLLQIHIIFSQTFTNSHFFYNSHLSIAATFLSWLTFHASTLLLTSLQWPDLFTTAPQFLYCETDKTYTLHTCLFSDLWESDKFFYPWPTPDLHAIFRPFKLCDLESAIKPSPIRKVVYIQANQTYEETGNTTFVFFPL